MINKKILVLSTKAITLNLFLENIINELKNNYNVYLGSVDIANITIVNTNKIKFFFPKNYFQLFNIFFIINIIYNNRQILKKNKFDLILTNTPLASHIIRISSIFLKSKIIYFVHGYRFHPKGNFLLNKIFFLIEKLLSYKTFCYININKIDYYITKKLFKKKSLLIDGVGIDINKKYYSFNGDINKNFTIGYIAAYKKNKGYNELLKLSKMLSIYKNIKIDCYGYGNINYFKKKKKFLKLNNIILNNFNKNILVSIKSFDVMLSFSKREGLPVSFLESMSQGVPVIANDVRGSNDLINHQINGFLLDSKNIVRSAYDYLVLLNENRNKLLELSLKSFEFIDERFDKTLIAKQVCKYINDS